MTVLLALGFFYFNTDFILFFIDNFPGLFKDTDKFFPDFKIHINPNIQDLNTISPYCLPYILYNVSSENSVVTFQSWKVPQNNSRNRRNPVIDHPSGQFRWFLKHTH